MTKKVIGLLILGILIAFGCSHGPMHEEVDTSTPLKDAQPIDLDKAVAQAKTENKLVFLDFTGSDWCPPCIEMHEKIFSQPEFQAYANSNLVFLTVDFPMKYHLPDAVNATNDFLSEKFNVEGFPIFVALNGDGKEVWRQIGPIDGGPKEMISMLNDAKLKTK